MQISEIHIDGFGVFSNKKVSGLTSGLNVFHGENEAGKTTLIEFVRRMLFEVNKRSKGFNTYPPLSGGRHGGRLKGQLASGEPFLISRNFSGKDDVTVSAANGELRGQSALDVILDHASINIFQNIFAFTLDELQNMDSLKDGGISNQIYGAELGLGRVSLKQVEGSISKRADAIFSPRGKKTQVNVLLQEIKKLEQDIRSIQDQAKNYDQLMGQLEHCEEQQNARQTQIEAVESVIRLLENRKELLKAIDEEEACLNELNIENESLPVNHDLLALEADIIFLQQSTQAVQSSLEDQGNVQREKTILENKVQTDLRETGISWSEERVTSFQFNRSKGDQIKSFLRTFEDLRQELKLAEDRLKQHQEKKAEELSQGSSIPAWLKFIAGALSFLGLASAAWSLIELNIPLLAAGILFLFFGGFIFWKAVKGKKGFIKEDLLAKTLEEKLDQAQLAINRKNLEWRSWLKEIAFDETLEPLSAQDMVNNLKEIQGEISRKAELEARIREMEKFREEITHRIDKIKPSIPEKPWQDHVPTNIKIISDSFNQMKDTQQRKQQIEKQMRQQFFKIEKLQNQVKATEDSLARINEQRTAVDSLEAFSGNQNFEGKTSLQEDLDRSTRQLKELDEEKNRLHETIGETRTKLKQLTSNEELLVHQETLEAKKQILNECAEEWAHRKIALFMLDAAKNQYEKTRQPGVLKAAEKIFSGITQGKYPRIVKPIGEDEILIENKAGDRKKATEMSRGTREQLYLAMRLGLIEEYESRSEPLPIIMDDVLVNFDDLRKIRVIEMLNKFAQSRQIIVLTCHKASLEDYLTSGANEIRL
ncbi:MAG: hypothetical protein NPINA01_01570 [Nitrospinaceae bacterium]|nr:MAG: hypothetical protein NPINA01_01570 [Nitrospinaceae bacterium]